MTWHRGSLCAFDTESTSVDPTTARIVTATVLTIDPPATIGERQWLLDPGVEIPAEAAAIHGVTTERARAEGRRPADALPEIADAIGAAIRAGVPLIIMNAAYDTTLLAHELARHDLPPLEDWCAGPVRPVIDPLVIDRAVDKYRKGRRTLTHLCEHYGVRLDGAHDASFDAIAAARVAWVLAERFADVGGATPDELHDLQVGWQAEWAAHLQEYRRSQGDPEAVVDGSWPLRPVAEGVRA